MSAFLVTGTSPDDYTEEDSIRIHQCICNEYFREDRGVEANGSWYCSQFCANRKEEKQAVLVRPQPIGQKAQTASGITMDV